MIQKAQKVMMCFFSRKQIRTALELDVKIFFPLVTLKRQERISCSYITKTFGN